MRTLILALGSAALLASSIAVATASPHGDERKDRRERHPRDRAAPSGAAIDAVYAKECGACHVAFPPRLLPAASWRKIVAGLDRHFGQDAALEPEVRARVEGWLVENAGRPLRDGAAPQRITELGWFRHEHRELPRGAIARPSVRSMANCAACHSGAERWDFDEDRVMIPRR